MKYIIIILLTLIQSYACDSTKIMVNLAHPDDEIIMPITLKKINDGCNQVKIIYTTHGEEGEDLTDSTITPDSLAKKREKETRRALTILGYDSTQINFLGISQANHKTQDIIDTIQTLFNDYKPEIIFTWSPTGRSLHPDHLNIWLASIRACDNRIECKILLTAEISETRNTLSGGLFSHVPVKDSTINLRISTTFEDTTINTHDLHFEYVSNYVSQFDESWFLASSYVSGISYKQEDFSIGRIKKNISSEVTDIISLINITK